MKGAAGRPSVVLLGLLLLLGLSGTASATPLGITLDPSPDLFFSSSSTSYNATTDAFTVSGFSDSYFLQGSACDPSCAGIFGSFSIAATIDASGVLGAGGTLSIGGTIGALSYNSGTLLTGNLTAFGFDAGTPALPFEFLFTVTGGDAAADFGGIGATGGIILSHNSSFSGSFASDFSSSFISLGDVGSVPEPSAALLLATGILGLSTRRKRLA